MGLFSTLIPLKKNVTAVLHIDVGRGNCRGSLVSHGARPEMIFSTSDIEKIGRERHDSDVASTVNSLSRVMASLTEYARAARKTGSRLHIEKVYAVLAAPYYLSHTALIKFQEKEAFTVTPKLVADLMSGYRQSTDPEYEAHDEAKIGASHRVVGERVVSIKVNGYTTAAPYGKRATRIDLSVFKTDIASALANTLEREIRKHVSCPISFEPLSLAVYVALRDHVRFTPDFLFVVVGNEVTDVSLVRDFTLLETVSFPFGRLALIRHISRSLQTSSELVQSALMMYVKNAMNEAEKSRMNGALGTGATRWFPAFEKALVELSDESTVPSEVFLVADADVQLVIKNYIETDSFSAQSLVPTGLVVTPVDTEIAQTVMHFGGDASCDTVLCLESLFALSTKVPIHDSEE